MSVTNHKHKHQVIDSDAHFTIDAITRYIFNDNYEKNLLIQGDHNSEKFTFAIPRYIDGHDMLLCNHVQVAYIDTQTSGRGKQYSTGVYLVSDLDIHPTKKDYLQCSWVISHNATRFEGALNFMLIMSCMEGELVTYRWKTNVFEGIHVAVSLDSNLVFEDEYVDIIEQWKNSVMEHFTEYVDAGMTYKASLVKEELSEDLSAEFANAKTELSEHLQKNINAFHDTLDNEITEMHDVLDGFDDILETEITNMDDRIDVLKARMDTFTALGEGSTTGDAELMDVRVGRNGATYKTAGEAVRGQFDTVVEEIDRFTEPTNQLFDYSNAVVFNGYLNANNMTITASNDVRSVSIPISVDVETAITVHKDYVSSRFLIASSTEANPTIGSPLSNISQDDGATELSLTVDSSVKSIVVLFWHVDTEEDTDVILRTLMVQYGSSYTGYEHYRVPLGYSEARDNRLAIENLTTNTEENNLAIEDHEATLKRLVRMENQTMIKTDAYVPEDILPATGFEFGIEDRNYSVYIPVMPNMTYRLDFEEATYTGANLATMSVFQYDADKNLIDDLTIDPIVFINKASGNYNGSGLAVSNFPMGGYRDIETGSSTTYVRFMFNNYSTVPERLPNGWTFSYQKLIHNFAVDIMNQLPKVLASNNIFIESEATVRENVYLGKTAGGVEMHGWYLTGIGTPTSEASGSGVDATSGRMMVVGGTTYRKPVATTFSVFDENDCLISTFGMSETICELPANAVYARLGFISSTKSSVQVVPGTKECTYEAGAYHIPGYSSEQHSMIAEVLNRNALTWKYSSDYIREIAFEANKYTAPNRHTFIFVTDTHTHPQHTYVESIVANMTKYVPCSYVAHGGDIIDGLSEKENELYTLSELNRNMAESNCPVFYCKGNHDDNCIYARTKEKQENLYITDEELYMRSNVFAKKLMSSSNKQNMYFYYDDDDTKIRSIFLNSFDNPETSTNGIRDEDAKTIRISDAQLEWVKNHALYFGDKTNPSEWGVLIFSHQQVNSSLKTVLTTFKNQGKAELIAWFMGDNHYDALKTTGYNFVLTQVITLNASLAQDNINVPTETNGILMPPVKVFGTEDDTAFDIVTVDRANHLIYMTRYGARSYAYNSETAAFDKIVARTRVIDYQKAEYTTLI